MTTKPTTIVRVVICDQFNAVHREFLTAAKAAAPSIITAVNRMRTMGLLLKELTGRETVTEHSLRDFLRDNPGALDETEITWLMAYVHTANKLSQGELALFEDASGYVQIVMQCAGLLSPAGVREIAQHSHELTPSVESWKYVTDFKLRFEGMLKGVADWNAEQRQAVKENVEKLKEILVELESRL